MDKFSFNKSDRNALAEVLRKNNIASVYERADRILSDQHVTCTWSKECQAPAWSIGEKIFFHEDRAVFDPEDARTMISFSGLNYHELCHVMYTPNQRSWLIKEIVAANLGQEFNILEDQRIESLMAAKYLSTSAYFTNTFIEYCLRTEDMVSGAHALAHGRKYLPKKLRKMLRKAYAKTAIVKDVEMIIDEYRLLVLADGSGTDERRAFELIRQFANLITQDGDPLPMGDPHGHDPATGRSMTEVNTPENSKDQQVLKENQQSAKRDMNDVDQNEGAYEKVNGSTESGSGDEDGKEKGQGKSGGGDEKEDGDQAGSGGDQSGKGDQGKGQSQGKGESDSGDDSDSTESGHGRSAQGGSKGIVDITREAEKIVKNIQGLDHVKTEIGDRQRVMRRNYGKTSLPVTLKTVNRAPDVVYRTASRKFGQTMQQLSIDADPGWRRRENSGRLNIQRAMHSDDFETVFDRWEEGQNDANDIELVLMVDVSGSMRVQIKDASQSAWSIKKAVDEIGGKTTVFAYDTTPEVAYTNREHCTGQSYKLFATGGSTNPYSTFLQAATLLSHSDAAHKILITITDGSWGAYDTSNPYGHGLINSQGVNNAYGCHIEVAKLRRQGVITALGLLSVGDALDAHEHQFARRLDTPMNIVDLAKEIVSISMARKR